MAFRSKVPAAKTFVALGSVAVGGVNGLSGPVNLDAIPSQHSLLHPISAVGLMTDSSGSEGLVLTREEIRISVSAVMAGKAMGEVYRKMPRGWAHEDLSLMKDIIGDAVENVLMRNPSKFGSLESATAAYEQSGLHGAVSERLGSLKLSGKDSVTTPDEEWNQLVEDHKCLICMDLLAAPVIIDCSHSFCGDCLHQYLKNSVSGEAVDEDVTHFCPTCRVEIDSNGIYERGLDTSVAAKVDNLAGCGQHAVDWRQRRQDHITRMKLGVNNGGYNDLDPPFDDIETYIVWVIAFLAVASISVATYLKRR